MYEADPLDHEGSISAVAWGTIDGEPVVVSGSLDHTVRLWEARTGAARGNPLQGHTGWGHSGGLGHDRWRASGGLWQSGVIPCDYGRLAPGEARGNPMRGHTAGVTAVAWGEINGQPVVVSGDRYSIIWIWKARTGEAWGDPLLGHEGEISAIAWGTIYGQPVVVSGSEDRTVRLWEARRVEARGGSA